MSDIPDPRVFITYAQESAAHTEQVLAFATYLHASIGLEVELDQWADGHRIDWSLWAGDHLREADFVLVIASPQYKRRAEGRAPWNVGNGAQYEAARIRDQLTRNLHAGTRRFLPVILPGGSVEDIPDFLNAYSTTRYHIDSFTEIGVSGLISAITGKPLNPRPPRAQWRQGLETPPADTRTPLASLPWLTHSPSVAAAAAVLDGVTLDNSLVLRPKTPEHGFVEVDLGHAYRGLTAVVGVLDDARQSFQVGHFQVFLDGGRHTEIRAIAGEPRTVEVRLAGIRRLRLEMHRPGTLRPGSGETGVRSAGLPELAWGNPMLF
ncbi:SEFIR domain-containing protein [Actinokineospora enzanensis]|uniref:SEFIR domain-containing protein n=1 Tax=Actinokineospora enzanensis TaxID=155975 RepID=UPI0003793AFA|nr:SEFIR domain-containing protein [Actinokineospora enzanensis]